MTSNSKPAERPQKPKSRHSTSHSKRSKPHADPERTQRNRQPTTQSSTSEASLHPRNRHQGRYDFEAISESFPDIRSILRVTPAGNLSIDFTDAGAVRLLNQALLKHWYDIDDWTIPDDYLCPPIPGRADYIHHLADLLTESNLGKPPKATSILALDIGCGANCIYPLIGASEYGWQFLASDIDVPALNAAKSTLAANPSLKKRIQLHHQNDHRQYFNGLLPTPATYADLTLCNPPFHDSPEQMERGNQRKWKNLKRWDDKAAYGKHLNFGGRSNELWCEGGELRFIKDMIRESRQYSRQIYWFTSLVSRQSSIPPLERTLRDAGVTQQRIINMAQGQKNSRFIAWSFLTDEQQKLWQQLRWAKR
jgi:23S rRNA (adenine1618-N6)-methyltransferase